MHFVVFISVAGMYLLLAKCIQMVIRTPKNAFRQHSNCSQNALLEPTNAFREHSNCTQMHLFLSRIGKQMHSNGHLEASKCMS